MNYAEADGGAEDKTEKLWMSEERQALAPRDVNRFPVYKVKDKESTFKQRFRIPLVNKSPDDYNSSRPAPTLGMRKGATFVIKPLHDPSGEFAIVLYDPTVDDVAEDPSSEKQSDEQGAQEEPKPTLDEPLVHKSLADILGLKKEVESRPKVPVVIDPRLAKILRPHQVDGVKVFCRLLFQGRLANVLVSVPLHHRHGRQAGAWLYHGRWDGSGKDGTTSAWSA